MQTKLKHVTLLGKELETSIYFEIDELFTNRTINTKVYRLSVKLSDSITELFSKSKAISEMPNDIYIMMAEIQKANLDEEDSI